MSGVQSHVVMWSRPTLWNYIKLARGSPALCHGAVINGHVKRDPMG